MSEIIFVRTRWNYDSYTDYWRLVELSGFPIVYVDEIDLSLDVTYILSPMNGEVHDKFGDNTFGRKAKIFMWNLERPSGSNGIIYYAAGGADLCRRYFDGILISDKSLNEACNALEYGNYFHYTTLGVHEGLGTPGAFQDKKYDLIHLCCYSNHRSELFVEPNISKTVLYGCTVAPNGWGDVRHKYLQSSRFLFNWHQDEHKYIEPLRFALAAAYGLPIISEICYNIYPYTVPDVVEISDLHQLSLRAKLYDYNIYAYGIDFRSRMLQNFQFRDCVEKVINSL